MEKRQPEMISEVTSQENDVVTVYYDATAQSCDERYAYARMDMKKTKDGEKLSYFAYYNGGTLCDPELSKRRSDSQVRNMKYENFLHYMNFLANRRRRSYVSAQKYE